MTSNDNQQYITGEIFRSAIGELRAEILSGFSESRKENKELRNEIQAVSENTIANGAKIDAYRDFTGIWFTVIAVIVAFVGMVAPLLRDLYKDSRMSKRQENLTEEKVQAMIDNAIAKVMRRISEMSGNNCITAPEDKFAPISRPRNFRRPGTVRHYPASLRCHDKVVI